MTRRMLIDASHPEETRVVVVNDQQLQEFDFESSTKKQLKGNIYLAKITRVEPSLQAAFVDYGGQRHGFLAFSEIHPDYYQIPQADRKVLDDAEQAEVEPETPGDEAANGEDPAAIAVSTDPDEEAAEVFDEQAKRRSRLLRGYKIQEVIKRRQIMLVQVVKEERGNKGAALTTYLSLAGRYSVLMPNTARGGGISRKIASPGDRSRLKTIARELEVPQGMGLIIRTAGQQRNKAEIRRDYEYSLRLWSDIRERTLVSVAPCMIHEEGALVKRAIRDLYSRDIDEVLVEGDEGYREAKKFMSMLMPSRARRVKPFKDDQPLFISYDVERQLDALHHPVVQLPAGGSIVINITEALTAIDVNSGRSTRERNIEETAVKTNGEAAAEIARQLRLRDIAGLVVIDFIDMNESRNQRTVERKLRDQLKSDRARVQLGRISAFGLLELSRQRLRPSFQESSTQHCPVCKGSGVIRSVESAALQSLRAVEIEGIQGEAASLVLRVPGPVALYVLNQKRDRLVSLEERYQLRVEIQVDDEAIIGDYRLERTELKPTEAEAAVAEAAEPAVDAPAEAAESTDDEADASGRKRRRRRRRRGKRGEGDDRGVAADEAGGGDDADSVSAEVDADVGTADKVRPAVVMAGAADAESDETEVPAAAAVDEVAAPEEEVAAAATVAESDEPAPPPKRPRPRRRRSRTKVAASAAESEAPVTGEPTPAEADTAVASGDNGTAVPSAKPAALPEAASAPTGEASVGSTPTGGDPETRVEAATADPEVPPAAVVDRQRTPRRGWWSRLVRKES